eukprot:8567_1
MARNNRKVFEGEMFKQGKFNKAWRSRWFVLYSTRKLAYYNTKKESVGLNAKYEEIDLTKVQSIVNDRSKDVQDKYVFELNTGGKTFLLACADLKSLNEWEKRLVQMVYGREIHSGWLIKKGDRIHSNWRKRWFSLSDHKELRYYDDDTQKKIRGTVDLSTVSIIRHGDTDKYGREYTIELITPDRTWVLETTYPALRVKWMEKLEVAMPGGIRMDVLYQGWLWKLEQSDPDAMIDWSKKYYGIDRETLNLYYEQSLPKFKQFISTLFFDQSYYAKAVSTQLQGCLSIKNAIVEHYGNDDSLFDNTSQKSNPWIFRVAGVLGNNYFAADNELGMKEWIHHLNLALGSGPAKVVHNVTAGGDDNNVLIGDYDEFDVIEKHANVQHKKPIYLDDNYLDHGDDHKKDDRAHQPQKHPYQAQYPHEPRIIKMHQPNNAQFIMDMVNNKKSGNVKQMEAKPKPKPKPKPAAAYAAPKFRFGPDGLPILDDEPMQPQSDDEEHEDPQEQQDSSHHDDAIGPTEHEIGLISLWEHLMSPYTHSPSKLEAEAQFPCNFDFDDQDRAFDKDPSSEMHSKCGVIVRLSTLMEYYMRWMDRKQRGAQCMGISFLISILSHYSHTELFNDFFHLKRFHAEEVADNYLIEPLSTYFSKEFGGCPLEQCVCFTRNNRNYLKCGGNQILRKWYYIDKQKDSEIIGNDMEWEEIVTQQLLDMIHCYIYHGNNFALYNTISDGELEHIRNIYSRQKQKFNQNRYTTNINKYHHMPYKPMDMGSTPRGFGGGDHNGYHNPPQLGGHYDDAKYNDADNMYEYTTNSFGVNMEHNMYKRALKKYGPQKYRSFQEEMLNHKTSALSKTQFSIIQLKASILLSTFEGKLLKARRIHDAASTFELDPKLYVANEYMRQEMCAALLIYCQCEELRTELMNTYFKVTHINESDNECRRRHYNTFYIWGKLLYTAIIAFGTDIYEDSNQDSSNYSFMISVHKNSKKKKFYYHNVTKPVLFNKFNVSFYGPTSCTTSKNVALIHVPIHERDGIVMELDTNNVGWTTPFYLNVSTFSHNPSECEQLFHGGACLGIHAVISVFHHSSLSNLSNYTSAITLLKYIIGDTMTSNSNIENKSQIIHHGINNEEADQHYEQLAEEILDEFDENICKHLEWLIDHQVEIYKHNKNINDDFSSTVPLYIALVFNSWCMNKIGIIQLNMKLLRKLPKPLQHKFVYESPEIGAKKYEYSINWSVVFNLFPKCNKIWKRGLYFNNYLCEQYVNFLCSEHITSARYKMDGIVFSCTAEQDWKKWVTTAKKSSSIIKQLGWLITASPPKKTPFGTIETGRVSFIKRIGNK